MYFNLSSEVINVSLTLFFRGFDRNCFLWFMDGLGVVLIDIDFQTAPQVEVG